MSEDKYLIAVNDEEFVSSYGYGLFGFKFGKTSSFREAFEFTKKDADKLVDKFFLSKKHQGKVVKITKKVQKFSQFEVVDVYVGSILKRRHFFGDVFNMSGKYTVEMDKGERFKFEYKHLILTKDQVFFIRFAGEQEANEFVENVLGGRKDVKVVKVPEIYELIYDDFGFRKLTAENDYDLDKMIDAYVRGGWQIQGERENHKFEVSQNVIRLRS